MQALGRIVLADACAIEFTYSVITGGQNNPKKRKLDKIANDDDVDMDIRRLIKSGLDITNDVALVSTSHEYSTQEANDTIRVSTN